MFFATPNNYSGTDSKNLHEIFAKEAFSKREAWCWLIANAYEEAPYRVKSSLRILAQEWQWPKTKVARFLKGLTSANLIKTENGSSFTIIKTIQNHKAKISPIYQISPLETAFGTLNGTVCLKEIQAVQKNAGTLSGTENQNISSNTAKTNQFEQKWDNFGTLNGTVQIKAETEIETNTGTESETKAGHLENNSDLLILEKEKKKQKKKRRKYQRKIFPKGNTKRKV